MSVLVVAPTRREAAACGPGTLVCGAGRAAATVVARRLRGGDVQTLIIAGFCGGLDPSLAPGTLVLARRATQPEWPELTPDAALFDAARRRLRAEKLPFVSSVLLTGPRPAGTRRLKTELWNSYGSGGVDMETYPIVQEAERRGVRWLALRAVLDPASATLPRAVRSWQAEGDERRIARAALLSPLDWPAYLMLAINARRAQRALRLATPLVVAAAGSVLPLDVAVASGSRLAVRE